VRHLPDRPRAATAYAGARRIFSAPAPGGLEALRQAAIGAALTAVFALAAKGLCEGLYYASQYSQDFQWSPTVLLAQGADPYAIYLAGDRDGRILMSQRPNYPHLLYVLLLPFAALPWQTAQIVWGLVSAAIGIVAAAMIARAAGLRGVIAASAVATFVAASPFAHALGAGQQSLLALLALTYAWLARGRASGGVALAVGVTKYSLAPPVALWLLLERRAVALAVAAATGGAGLLVFAALCGANPGRSPSNRCR
jgi:hypothetical protein